MRIIRFDSVGGASGDMLLGALIGLGADAAELNRRLETLIPGEFKITAGPFESFGINGIQAGVELHEHDHHHHHHGDDDGHHGHHHHHHGRSFREIRELIQSSALPEKTRRLSLAVFTRLAQAEAKIHGKAVDDVHFHEVGAVDSIVDIVGCCLALELLGVDAVSVSSLPTGSGLVRCAHGIYPVPAPATAELLTGLKSRPCEDEPFEMVTPTGAALLAVWPKAEITAGAVVTGTANSFGKHPYKTRPNLLRALLYEETGAESENADEVILLETNIDDSTPEVTGHLCGLLAATPGVADAWTTPIMMKKQRPAVMLSILVKPVAKETVLELIFRESSTFGVREYPVVRHCLERRFEEVETPYGKIKVKVGLFRGREVSRSPEYEDCRRAAEAAGVPLKTVYQSCILN